LHAPLLGVILHAYVECTEVINNIDTIIVTLPVVFTGSLSDIQICCFTFPVLCFSACVWGWVILLGHKCVVCVKLVKRYLICKSGECLVVLGYGSLLNSVHSSSMWSVVWSLCPQGHTDTL